MTSGVVELSRTETSKNETDSSTLSPRNPTVIHDAESPSISSPIPTRRIVDTQLTQQLDQEYEWALEERDVAYHARYQSVRQSACCAVTFMTVFMTISVIFFVQQTEDWDTKDALLFSVYAMTTVGYGHLHSPDTPAFQLYTIFFILMGIATLTILVAQVYQCVALEASRAQSEREQPLTSPLAQHHRRTTMTRQSVTQLGDFLHVPTHTMDQFFQIIDQLQTFFKEDEVGRGLSVLFPFVGLIGLGALVVGPLEGWTIVEALYFSVVSLTTVGFGDYYPTQSASIWFCVIWLPFSVGFMSLYLTNVAAFYIRLSDSNILRIEQQLRKAQILQRKRHWDESRGEHRHHDSADPNDTNGNELDHDDDDDDETDPESSGGEMEGVSRKSTRSQDGDGFENIPRHEKLRQQQRRKRRHAVRRLFGTLGSAKHRRERILQTVEQQPLSSFSVETITPTPSDDTSTASTASTTTTQEATSSMITMREVLQAVHADLAQSDDGGGKAVLATSEFVKANSSDPSGADTLMVIQKPSFALRALVQERLAAIIAIDVAGYQDSIEIQDRTLSMSIQSLKQTADRWKIPKRARKAFRAVAFEVLFFVGEFGLVTRGAEALFDLPPLVFSSLFAPLLAAMGDAPWMESWLVRTQVLADVDLQPSLSSPSQTGRPLDMDRIRSAVAVAPQTKTARLAVGVAQMKL
ncbi:potassium channel subfamily K member 5 [Fistulifera solaris]|uniref:Potassium channel subfamily K member 5 n=1 Tax=Fistulifera solaris TaxID=1519565 RepID=A0A1Z5JD81_FISSO|nr:potassium channel subfamily K member 5 [Fistulifera solaris]|eukprot:GAX11929.1 potassium channel subfamily K member 5 [Fistulifera solaris]